MYLQYECCWGHWVVVDQSQLLCHFNIVWCVALKKQPCSKNKRQQERNMAVLPNAQLQSAEWSYFTRADIDLFKLQTIICGAKQQDCRTLSLLFVCFVLFCFALFLFSVLFFFLCFQGSPTFRALKTQQTLHTSPA